MTCVLMGHGTVSVDPSNASVIYIAGVPLLKSTDGGSTFTSVERPTYMSTTTSFGWTSPTPTNSSTATTESTCPGTAGPWIKCTLRLCGTPAAGSRPSRPVSHYGGLQDGGTWVAITPPRIAKAWHQTVHYGFTPGGGDGMQIEVDNRSNEVVTRATSLGVHASTAPRESAPPCTPPMRWEKPCSGGSKPRLSSESTNKTCSTWLNKVHRSSTATRLRRATTRHEVYSRNVPFGTLPSRNIPRNLACWARAATTGWSTSVPRRAHVDA